MTKNPEVFWGLIASMRIGNIMLVIINLPLIGLWVRLLRVPYRLLYPAILVFCCIGAYSVNNNDFDVSLISFGFLGYAFEVEREPAPLMLAFVLSPMLEDNLRRAMLISGGDAGTFVERPLSLSLLVLAGILLAIVLVPSIRRSREKVFVE